MGAQIPLLAFFTDSRSGPARRMESPLAQLAGTERGRLRIQTIDVGRHRDLVERLRVRTVPTLLLVKDRRVVARIEGRASAPRIERMIAPHLDLDGGTT